MNFFKKLFGREEEVSLKPSVGKQKERIKSEREVKEEIETSSSFNFAESFPDLPKIEMTKLAQTLQRTAEKKTMQEKINAENNTETTDGTTKADFSAITSTELALAEVRRGNLEPLFLIDERFGGSQGIENTVFVPVGAAKIKESFDTVLENMLREGRRLSFNCQPEYKGKSFVPSAILMTATDSETGKQILDERISIW